MRDRLRLTQAEQRAILARLLQIPQIASRPAEYVAADAWQIAEDIEAIRQARIAAKLELGPGQHVEEDDEHGVHIGFHELPALPAHVEGATRGRPSRDWDGRLRARLQLIKRIYAVFPPGTAKLTQRDGARPGSDFEELAAFALRLAGEPVGNAHRECTEAVRQINIERA